MRRSLLPLVLVAGFAGFAPHTLFAQRGPALAPPQRVEDEPAEADRVDLKSVVVDSLRLVTLEHLGRITFQDKTRRELGGPFWKDYRRAVRTPRTWGDGDSAFVNYLGHPIHGAAAGFIWVQNDPRGREEDFNAGARYWASRGRAAAWSAGYSLQFEFGPLSEASVGNVGIRPNTTGWVDHVVTPLGGFGFVVAEDALDRYLVRWVERRTANRWTRATARVLLNPSRSLANVSDLRSPWFRNGRPLGER